MNNSEKESSPMIRHVEAAPLYEEESAVLKIARESEKNAQKYEKKHQEKLRKEWQQKSSGCCIL